jgi:hypothetical protein
LLNPFGTPATSATSTSTHTGVPLSSTRAMSSPVASRNAPPTASVSRGPRIVSLWEATTVDPTEISAIGNISRPDCIAVNPAACSNHCGSP